MPWWSSLFPWDGPDEVSVRLQSNYSTGTTFSARGISVWTEGVVQWPQPFGPAAIMRALILILLVTLFVTSAAAASFEGPLQVRNQFPLYLGMNPPYLEQAAVESSFSAVLHYSSTYVTQGSTAWTVNMDLELAEFDLRFKKKAGERTEVGLDIPIIRPSEGFLDRPLETWHDF